MLEYGGTVNVSFLTFLAVSNLLPTGVGANQASGGWLSSTICTVSADDYDSGAGVSTAIDGEVIMLLS